MVFTDMNFAGEKYTIKIGHISSRACKAKCFVYKNAIFKLLGLKIKTKKLLWSGYVECLAMDIEFITPTQIKMTAEQALISCINYINEWEIFNESGEAKGNVFAKAILERMEKGKF